MKFYRQKPEREGIVQHLLEMNQQITFSVSQKRLLIGLDGTCSMSRAFDAIKKSLKEMVRRIYVLKKDLKKDTEGFEMQISKYTNYND